MYIGKHRSAILRGPSGAKDVLRALNDRLQQLIQAMSFTTETLVEALADRVPLGQPGAEWKRPFKSSFGMAKPWCVCGGRGS